MNFIFGIIVGVGVTLFACKPAMLGDALHWAGDKVVSEEATKVQENIMIGPMPDEAGE